MKLDCWGLKPNEAAEVRDLPYQIFVMVVIIVLLFLVLPSILRVYFPDPGTCVDWQHSNPTISYVEQGPCPTTQPFTPVP